MEAGITNRIWGLSDRILTAVTHHPWLGNAFPTMDLPEPGQKERRNPA